ncbi:MAG: zf-HC2 domain-containing protein [Pseudomonadota bacterium]|nr:zf-HC2 domain-containing protein [Pseudomonadota bacterium]
MNPSHPQQFQQRVQALVVLATQETDSERNCLSDHQLSSFIANQLSSLEREQVIQHLHACPQCYQHWQTVMDTLATPSRLSLWLERVNAMRQQALSQFQLQTLSLAAVMGLIMLIVLPLWLQPPTLSQQIKASYQLSLAPQTQEKLQAFKLKPRAQNRYGLVDASSLTPATQAFISGLISGKAQLLHQPLPTAATTIEEYPSYFELGRWLILLWSVTQTQTPLAEDFWQQQQQILTQFQTQLTATPLQTLLLPQLAQLEPLLISLPHDDYLQTYHQINRILTWTLTRSRIN